MRTPDRLYVGLECQKCIHGEYDLEVTTSTLEGYEYYCFNDAVTGWLWVDHIITAEDVEEYRDRILGNFRVK